MSKAVNEDFRGQLDASLTPLEIGTGRLERGDALRLCVDPAERGKYSDAQIFNYQGLKRRDFPSRPPLRMVVRAWASHPADQLIGTAGFGFWNQPVMPGTFDVRLPRAVWFFFASPPSNMALARDVPGYGWKAATIDASRAAFLLLAPTAPLGFLMMRRPALYRTLWPVAQRAIGVAEQPIAARLDEPHVYRLDWLEKSVSFYVDDHLILETPYSPHGPLGFVTWLDNQFAVVTPQGRLVMGLLPVPQRQWLALDLLKLEPI